jgi:hypothetical protein
MNQAGTMNRGGTIVTGALNLVGTTEKLRNEVLLATKVSQWV